MESPRPEPEPEVGRKRAHPTYLYARLLAGRWSGLPAAIRRMHALDDRLSAAGRARVERGTGILAGAIAGIAGFPPAAEDVAVRVDFERRGEVETWRRQFGDHVFQSTQEIGRNRRLVERFGPAAFAMRLSWDGKRLNLDLRHWRLYGVPMPGWLSPSSVAYEHVVDGRFAFFVEISHPMTGLIVRYQGWLEPVV